jgi:hypothetical protein
MPSQFTTSNEKALHAALKAWLAGPEDQCEAPVGRYVIDIVQAEHLVEIQTRSFAALRTKLTDLLQSHRVRLVYPIAQESWIVKLASDQITEQSRRKSPKRSGWVDLFAELVSFPTLLNHANFSIEVLLIRQEEVRRHECERAWRRNGWVTHERRLISVEERRLFQNGADLAALLPASLAASFTAAELAQTLGRSQRLAQQMVYCLRQVGVLEEAGKRGRAKLYVISP